MISEYYAGRVTLRCSYRSIDGKAPTEAQVDSMEQELGRLSLERNLKPTSDIIVYWFENLNYIDMIEAWMFELYRSYEE